jgi:iron complex outermembrane receptor protein
MTLAMDLRFQRPTCKGLVLAIQSELAAARRALSAGSPKPGIPKTARPRKSHRLAIPLLAAAPVLVLVPGEAAFAADPPVTQMPELQPIVVTATRQQTTVQTTPISISAVTSSQIASRGLVDVDSLVRSVPGIAVRNTGGPGEQEYEIRGLNSQGGSSSMVGMYFGEIPLSTALNSQVGKDMMSLGLYDIERVEALRGPQGTLYGSSSMGGTIRVLPQLPQLNTFSGSTQEVVSDTASGGGINHQENGMINMPLGSTAAVRVVGSFTSDSGWIQRRVIQDGAVAVDAGSFPNVSRPDNFYTAPLQENLQGVNTTQVHSVRAELLWEPTANLTIQPTLLYQMVQQGAPPTVDVNGTPTNPTTPKVLAHWEIYDEPEPQTDSLSLGSLNMVYRLPAFSVTSATGFWHRNFLDMQSDTENVAAVFGIPVYDAAAGGIGLQSSSRGPGTLEQDYSRQLSEEFRLTSTAPGPLQWVAGYFYQDLYSEDANSALAPQATAILGGPNVIVESNPEVMVQNAVYGHVSWRFSPHFAVAAGFRHYHYSLNETSTEFGSNTVLAAEGNTVPYNFATSIAASGTVPSLNLTYNIDGNHMVYARVDKGFRLGGASADTGPVPVVAASNTNPILAVQVANECGLQAKVLLTSTCDPNIFLQAPTTYGSDSLWSYELGEKSEFFHHRLMVNLDGYLEDWYHPQIATNVAGFGFNVNGGNARIKGIEGQLQALLPGGFDLSLNGSYVDAKFIQTNALTGYPAGTRIPDTPETSGSAILGWKHYLGNSLSLYGSLEDDYVGSRTDLPFGVTATLVTMDQMLIRLPAYSIANVRFGIRGERAGGDHWAVALFVNNFTNNIVLIDPQPQISLQDAAFSRYVVSQPLTAGIDLSYAFR